MKRLGSLTAIVVAIAACARAGAPRPTSPPPPRVDGLPTIVVDSPPRQRDSIMKTGPYAGAPARLRCDLRRAAEPGDIVPCWISTMVVGPRGPMDVRLPWPDTLHSTTPNLFAVTSAGELIPRRDGWSILWARVNGAVAMMGITVNRRVGSLVLEPNVRDTTIHVGDTLLVRVLALDDTGYSIPIPRGSYSFAPASTGGGRPGTFDQVDSVRWRLVARGTGSIALAVMFQRRTVRMNIKIDSAPPRPPPARVIAVRPPLLKVVVTRGASRVRRAGVVLDADAAVRFTDSTGAFQFQRVAYGKHTLHISCPVSRRTLGREFASREIEVGSTADTTVEIAMTPLECAEPMIETMRGTFEGVYTTGFDGEWFRPCTAFRRPVADAYDLHDPLAWVSLDEGAARDPRLAKLLTRWPAEEPAEFFVRWSGTLTGPGSYGTRGAATHVLFAQRILEIRRAAPGDCKR